jgi:hypothetical protein
VQLLWKCVSIWRQTTGYCCTTSKKEGFLSLTRIVASRGGLSLRVSGDIIFRGGILLVVFVVWG